MSKLQVRHLRQDAVNDYFEVWYGSEPDYRTYPRSMEMTAEQLHLIEQEKIDQRETVEQAIDKLVNRHGREAPYKTKESMKSEIIKTLC